MRQTELLKRCKAITKEYGTTFDFVREGRSHTLYNVNGRNIVIPRHREINERTANSILGDTETASREPQR